ncbi:MAG: hypothetical protein JST19_05405 [Bacteroidetes bacterium]|nr:hypothetical protein [Bacteroidota bacterium]
MKRLIIISGILLSGLMINTAEAQLRIHLGFNFGARPVVVAAPAEVAYTAPADYDGDGDDYYYLPDVDAYYSVPEQCYYYNDGGSWVSAAYLPGAYRDYDWRSARRFEVRAARPFMHDDYYRARFNGVVFNGWNERGYARGYANDYYRNDRRFEDHRFEGRRFDEHRFEDRDGDHFRNDRGYDNGYGRGREGFAMDNHRHWR